MLTHLSIRNYVLIKQLDIDWQEGFSVITGETGAGKSILLGAIGLLTGQRADSKSILPGATKCTIEGTFKREGRDMQDFCASRELDYEDGECIVRRELTASGKSRAFVNDTPVTVADLRALSHLLVDIHSQHQNLLLGQEDFQLNVLDTVARDAATTSDYHTHFVAYRDAHRLLEEAREQARTAKAEEDYLTFQLGQIEELHLRPQEDEALREEQQALTHAGEIRTALYQSAQMLGGDDNAASVLDGLKGVAQSMRAAARIYPALVPYSERVESAIIELKDIETDITDMGDSMESNPERLDEVTARLDAIYSLEQKHGVKSSDELLDTAHDLRERLDAIGHSEEQVAALEAREQQALAQATRLADELTRLRQAAAREVEQHVKDTLTLLEMPDTQFDIRIAHASTLGERGADQVTFLFSANKNMPPRPIAEAASGGETARVMLALKALMGMRISMPTILFDEIDTGVSGRVADAMARLMKQMSATQGQQVIAITHLPQIAAQGGTHYYVYKENTDQQTVSRIRRLTDDERVTELAHMLSGNDLTQAAIDNARQLLGK